MKHLPVFIILLGLILSGCEIFDIQQNRDMNTSFTLTDTLGQTADIFHSGEDFILTANLINTLDDTVFYDIRNSGPLVFFTLLQGDSVVASSSDGMGSHCVIIPSYSAPGDTQSVSWTAPTTLTQVPSVTLEPGFYTARASWNIVNINECPLDTLENIDFTVIR